MESVFDALGDPTRRMIVRLLATGEQPVGALVEELQTLSAISQPAVSQHLKALRDAGLVTVRSEGRHRVHALDTAGVDAARAWLNGLIDPLAALAQPLDALDTELARGKKARKNSPQTAGNRKTTTARRKPA
jgi:DNA-binding transcriptional ArsR family regulator